MHPPLHRDHPDCVQVINDLIKCHEENKLGKWFGKCNDMKAALDQCFREEKEKKRKVNLQKSIDSEDDYIKYRLKIDSYKNTTTTISIDNNNIKK